MATKKQKIDPLPDTLSGLITVALADLKACEASPNYKINMDIWHDPDDGKVCAVCFAGAVMAKTLKASPLCVVDADDWWNGIANKLTAINRLRCGEIESAASELVSYWPDAKGERYRAKALKFEVENEALRAIPAYDKRTRTQFHGAMKKLASALKHAGL